YCVSALILASLLHRQVTGAGLALSLQRLLAELTDIREVHGLSSASIALDGSRRRGRPRTSVTYTRLNAQQRRLVEILRLGQLQTTPYIHPGR
ncbi:MAG: hypothetical protein QME96_18570, partial [Myxococcota bacterium]|nr:hypothetical protein [Myxococcota bacterium]